MGARRPFLVMEDDLATTYDTERQLQRDISRRVEAALPGVEVLAVELQSPSRFCVYIDHAQGVDHALCERVTNVLRGYLDRYTIDVSSPGEERPLRKPGHFRNAAGQKTLTVAAGPDPVDIPYDAIVRSNLIDEVTRP